LGTLSAYVFRNALRVRGDQANDTRRPSTRNLSRHRVNHLSYLTSPFLGLPRTVSVCALLLHAPYLFPHTRLPTGIITCTHGSPAPVLALTPRFFDWCNGTRIPSRLVPNREGAARRDSNTRSIVPQNNALPLSYGANWIWHMELCICTNSLTYADNNVQPSDVALSLTTNEVIANCAASYNM
jgi:hypothetical protein